VTALAAGRAAFDPASIAGKELTNAEHTDLLVVGAGPAGIAAALEGRHAGVAVVLVDENPVRAETMGGDIPHLFGGAMSGAARNRAVLAHETAAGDVKLVRYEPDGARRHIVGLLQEGPEKTHRPELDGEAQPHVGATPVGNECAVGIVEGGVPRELLGVRLAGKAAVTTLLQLGQEGDGHSSSLPVADVPGPDHPARSSVSISVVRLAPNVRQTAALVAPVLSAAIIASCFSGLISGGGHLGGHAAWQQPGRHAPAPGSGPVRVGPGRPRWRRAVRCGASWCPSARSPVPACAPLHIGR